MPGLCGRCMFKFLRSCWILFQSDCTILQSHQCCMRVSGPPQPCQHLHGHSFSCKIVYKVCLTVVLIFSSLKPSSFKHVFMSFFPMVSLTSLIDWSYSQPLIMFWLYYHKLSFILHRCSRCRFLPTSIIYCGTHSIISIVHQLQDNSSR